MVTGSLHEAEDIVQDAFLKVWERWPEVSTMKSPVGYLHRAAMNLFRNRYRRAGLAVRKATGAAPPTDAFGMIEDRVSIERALGSLTPRQRAALVLTELLDYSTDEAGQMLGVRASTIRSLTAAGRSALKDTEELIDG
jgi:RNA polymerase sigma factor (sigma-70 family)